jgi:hypothetical protein
MKINTYRDIAPAIAHYLTGVNLYNQMLNEGLEVIVRKLWGTYGAEPVGGIVEDNRAGIIFGWDDLPAGMITYGRHYDRRGDVSFVWKLHSTYIRKEKGEPFVTKATTAKGLLPRLTKDLIKRVDINDLANAGFFGNEIRNHSFGGIGGWAPSMDSSARYQALEFLTGREKDIGQDLKEWIEKACKEVAADNAAVDKARHLRKAFCSRAVVISELNYKTDKPYVVREAAFPSKEQPFVQLTEPRLIASIDELIDDYPHIVGANNLYKLQNPNRSIFSNGAFGSYKETYNFFSSRFTTWTVVDSIIFPAVFDELPQAQEVKAESTGCPIVDIFSLDL